ncbi:protein-cysteine N-palmitoyltransferase HHAT-like [Dermacentor silvarum]|uniref:protein-cysteine N-palmitoyltransferase HHAT-like n=1 Tax=Dermacentor silvarum TaxID=543639 RepID=UPI0021009D60|nr:protein-cysteine N-palmitoyltransferase HHAT-like [Dermacentor silvarum]
MYPRYGLMPYRAAYVSFHWNLMRGLSFSVDFTRAERQKHKGDSRSRWPPYWLSLAYFVYLPTVYLGPPLNYDDFVAQLNKTRPSCTPRVIAGAVARLLRSGAHFFFVELMGHFFYSSAMSEWPWMVNKLDLPSLVGYALSLLFVFYVSYQFTYGFAGALANAEGVEVPPRSPCIAVMHRCSHFWRNFDRGMHLWIRSYIYEPVVRGNRTPFRLVLGTAVAFSFNWLWHSMHTNDGIWCALSVLGIALEVITAEARKWTPVKNFEVWSALMFFTALPLTPPCLITWGSAPPCTMKRLMMLAPEKASKATVSIDGLPSIYNFKQLHFHWGAKSTEGSEHHVDGKSNAMEMHLVHINTEYGSAREAYKHPDGFLVVGVLCKVQP